MRKIIGAAFVSIDGVIQAPGGTTEDWTGGFTLGGWLPALFDGSVGEAIDELFSEPFDLLLGRRTYDIFAAYWPYVEGEGKPMGEMFDRVGKYVVTRGDQSLEWQNSHRVGSLDTLGELKRSDGPDLLIQGSSTLYPQLLAAGLIDRLTLMTFPLVLGQGKRLFGEGTPSTTMKITSHVVSPGGTIIATYEPAGDVQLGTIGEPVNSQREQGRQEKMAAEDTAT